MLILSLPCGELPSIQSAFLQFAFGDTPVPQHQGLPSGAFLAAADQGKSSGHLWSPTESRVTSDTHLLTQTCGPCPLPSTQFRLCCVSSHLWRRIVGRAGTGAPPLPVLHLCWSDSGALLPLRTTSTFPRPSVSLGCAGLVISEASPWPWDHAALGWRESTVQLTASSLDCYVSRWLRLLTLNFDALNQGLTTNPRSHEGSHRSVAHDRHLLPLAVEDPSPLASGSPVLFYFRTHENISDCLGRHDPAPHFFCFP